MPYPVKKVRRQAISLLLICSIAAAILFLPVPPGKADSALPLPDPHYSDALPPYMLPPWEKINSIIYPVLGCPVLAVAGQRITALVREDDGGVIQDWIMKIATHDPVSQIYTASDVTAHYDSAAGCYLIEGTVPSHVPRDVFDLIITNQSLSLADIQVNAVRVITEFKDNYRFVHLTDLHFGDPRRYLLPLRPENSAAPLPSLINQIFTELSFLDPEFILFSGDLVFGSAYYLEYPWSWSVLSSYALATFMVPGNHDGYASGSGLLRDGLEYWQQIIGPLYFSFNYGDKYHFVCINTYDGTAMQRESISFISRQWGGTLGKEQQEWLKDDLEKATREGRNSIICGHHDPRGDVHGFGGSSNCADEDSDGYAEATEFPDALCYQEWNDRESGEALVQLIRRNNTSSPGGMITHFLLGHVHSDYIDWDDGSNTWWVHTNSAGSSAASRDDFFGYRVIEVEGSRVTRVNRTAPEGEIIPPGDNDPSNNQRWDYQSHALNNIVITTRGTNDGRSAAVTREITNYFDTPVSGVLEFYMPLPGEGNGTHNNFGYHITGGTIRTIARSGTDGDGNKLVFYVDTEINPGETKPVTLKRNIP